MISFIVSGEPQGKARPRVTKFGAYTPEKTVLYENWIKMCAKVATSEYFEIEQLEIRVKAFYKIPKSVSIKKYADMHRGAIRPTKKPDIDNVLKVVCDSLNGILYKDDAQIVRATVEKWYSDDPRVEIELEVEKC